MADAPRHAWWDEVALVAGTLGLRVRANDDGSVRLVAEGVASLDVELPAASAVELGLALCHAGGWPVREASDPVVVTPPAAVDQGSGAVAEPAAAAEPARPWTDPAPAPELAEAATQALLAHLRRLASVLPEAREVDALGAPTFRVATRIFAVAEMVEDVPVLRVKTTLDEQVGLLADPRFRADPETGHHGWTTVRVDLVDDPDELDPLVLSSYRLVAPADAIVELDRRLATRAREGRDDTGGPGTDAADHGARNERGGG